MPILSSFTNDQFQDKEHYFLDAVLTVAVIHTLVVFYWRGTWELFDVYLYPNDVIRSGVACLLVGYALQCLLCVVQPLFNILYRQTSSPLRRWLLEASTFFIANFVGVAHWRGCWLLTDAYVLPDKPEVSCWLTHAVGIATLMVLHCSHSVTLVGCNVEGDTTAAEGCFMPNRYLRYFVAAVASARRHRLAAL